MKDYRSQFDALHFSPEEKQAMIDDLLATAPETRRRVSHKKRVHVLIAAVIAAALCAACASGALQAAIQSLSFFLGNQPEQTQVLGQRDRQRCDPHRGRGDRRRQQLRHPLHPQPG